jgi:hypothetical protein
MKIFLRQPIKIILSIAALTLSSILFFIGESMFIANVSASNDLSAEFTTVGTVSSMSNAGYKFPEGLPYVKNNALIRPTILTHISRYSDGVRLYTCESSQEYKYKRSFCIFEALEDLNIDNSAENYSCKVKIIDELYGQIIQNASYSDKQTTVSINIQEEKNEKLQLKKGKKYICCQPAETIDVENIHIPYGITEYSDDFFTSELGKVYSDLIEAQKTFDNNTFPVVPTRSLEELTSYKSSEAVIVEGRMITDEEFKSGAKVCVVPETLVRDPDDSDYHNNVKVGDKLTFTMLAADYTHPSIYLSRGGIGVMTHNLLLDDTTITEVYQIVGVYASPYDGSYDIFDDRMADETVIIPYTDNLVFSGINNAVYNAATTSFTIENGKILDFTHETSDILGDFDISFFDGGYSAASSAVDLLCVLGITFLILGLLSFITVMAFILVFCISKKKHEIGIEMSLGVTPRRCRLKIVSEFLGIITVSLLLSVIVSFVSVAKLQFAVYDKVTQIGYNQAYSNYRELFDKDYFLPEYNPNIGAFVVTTIALIALATLAVYVYCWYISKEKIMLLIKRFDE